ncbi:MAG: DNA double-strand break repair nuclease NurA [Promethearchaeota archaeon]
MALEITTSESFEQTVRRALQEIKSREEFKKGQLKDDLPLLRKMLTSFQPVNNLKEDFLVGGVDGSGIPPLLRYDDIMIHIITANLAVHNTGSHGDQIMQHVPLTGFPPVPEGGQLVEAFWISMENSLTWKYIEDFIRRVYAIKNVDELLFPLFGDVTGVQVSSFKEIAKLGLRVDSLEQIATLPPASDSRHIHDLMRSITEFALAKLAMESNLSLKYLLIDTSLTLLIPKGRKYSRLIEDYLKRDLCMKARRNGIILLAVSKTHTIPCASLIAELAEKEFGKDALWFCRMTGDEDPEGRLSILRDRYYVPPVAAVTYIFRFSRDSPIFRLDLDRNWWKENVYDEKIQDMKKNERKLFSEIEYISRDARWFGYPTPLSFAHINCKVSKEVASLMIERAISIAKEEGFDDEKLIDPRSRVGL